jgi:hypothetical protein
MLSILRIERELAARTGSIIGTFGGQNRVWVKVHPLRDGGWATTLAHERGAARWTAQVLDFRERGSTSRETSDW